MFMSFSFIILNLNQIFPSLGGFLWAYYIHHFHIYKYWLCMIPMNVDQSIQNLNLTADWFLTE